MAWRRVPADGVAPPIIRRVPYLELKLEHPGLDATGHGDRFYPDAVPYECEGVPRVFYWRPALTATSADPEDWTLVTATTHGLTGVDVLPARCPPLVGEGASAAELVVDGTVAGESTTFRADAYEAPTVQVTELDDEGVTLQVADRDYTVPVGERRRCRLHERRVGPVDGDGTTVEPELVARYPGPRELHHPAVGTSYCLFPSFGLDLDEIPNPLPIPTATDQLDDEALASQLDVDLSHRPYPERVLWKAFAHTAFGPHADGGPQLAQLSSGHIVLLTEEGDDT